MICTSPGSSHMVCATRAEIEIFPPIVEQGLAGISRLPNGLEQISARPLVQTEHPALVRIQLSGAPCCWRFTSRNLHDCRRKSEGRDTVPKRLWQCDLATPSLRLEASSS